MGYKMKLILANNQTDRFRAFYDDLRQQSEVPFDYVGYESLVFIFDNDAPKPITVKITNSEHSLHDYDGVYLNGYLDTYELAATTAICCESLGINFANRELASPASLSKLTGYAKLIVAGVRIPKTVAGSKTALLQAREHIESLSFPLILKRADADRGIDNFKVESFEEITELLATHPPRSLWISQEYVENDGFYLMSFYSQKPAFCIFRSLEARPDNDRRKAHMFKPKGGANAHLIPLEEVPDPIRDMCQKSMLAMNRQIGSVDCLYDPATGLAHILEVNYNPQLVTIETFRDTRIAAFLEGIKDIN